MFKRISIDHNGISGKVLITLKDADGKILKRVQHNTINNSLRTVWANLLRYGSNDPTHFPEFKVTKLKISGAENCHESDNTRQITSMCGVYEITDENLANDNDVTLIKDMYSFINAGQEVDVPEVRFGIVIPMEYKFKVGGVDTDTYMVKELGLFANIGGSETLIAWTHLGENSVQKRPENIMTITWIIQID